MCEYCDKEFCNNKLLTNSHNDSEVEVDPDNCILNIDYAGYDEYYFDDIEINYCPMCGRKLRRDE